MPDARKTTPLSYTAQLELIDRALEGRSLAELRERLGIAERTLRCYKAPRGRGFVELPYSVRYALEVIAGDSGTNGKHDPNARTARRRGVPKVRRPR